MRTLVVAGRGKPAEAELRHLIAADAMPDAVSAEDAVGATIVDDRYMATVAGLRGPFLRRLPLVVAQTVEILLRGKQHDAVLTWGDLPAISIALATRVWKRRPAHVAILMWPSKPKKAMLLRISHSAIDRMIVPSPVQRRFLEEKFRISRERFIDLGWAVDTRFWRPMEGAGDLICSVGQEMRDYGTLVEALRSLAIPCHIAAGTGIFGATSEKWWREDLDQEDEMPAVTLGRKSFADLRELYARSRFVVVPLVPSDSDNGITTILEAFAMGKAVICTETPGQTGVLEHGVNCLRVPSFDAEALRRAILTLWNDPAMCRRLGAAGRQLVVEQHSLDLWAAGLARAVHEAVAARNAVRAGANPAESSVRRSR